MHLPKAIVLAGSLVLGSANVLLGTSPGFQPDPSAVDPRVAAVERAFRASPGDLTGVRVELTKVFTSNNIDVRDAGLRWIGQRATELSDRQFDDLSELFIQLTGDRDSARTQSVRESMAWRRFSKAPYEDRVILYRTAVRNGKAYISKGVEVDRVRALCDAARLGLEEFEPAIRQNAQEMDAGQPQQPLSPRLLWQVRLRAGARTEQEAISLHAKRLLEMDDQRVAELIATDKAFFDVTWQAVRDACVRNDTEPCADFARVMLRQDHFRKAHPASAKEFEHWPEKNRDWLEPLLAATAAHGRFTPEEERKLFVGR